MREQLGAILATGAVDLEQLADAIWLSQYLPHARLGPDRVGSPDAGSAAHRSAAATPPVAPEHRRAEVTPLAAPERTDPVTPPRIGVVAGGAGAQAHAGVRFRSPGVPPLAHRVEFGRALRYMPLR